MTTTLVSRQGSGLAPPRSTTPLRAEGNTAHYGGNSPWPASVDRSTAARFQATCDHNRCASIVRAWQSFHMAPTSTGGRGWQDIAYSSAVCPHGVRYDLRGPGKRTGANGTNDGNNRSHATVYIAGGRDPLTDAAKHAFLDEEARLGPIKWDHSKWKSTACAGDPIRAWIAAGKPRPGGSTTPPPVVAPALPPSAGGTRLLRVGVRGPDVLGYQQILVGAGELPASGADSVFGPQTEAATKRFQRRLGVDDDGVVGPKTRAAINQLFRFLAAAAKPKPGAPTVPERIQVPGTLRRGDSGAAVRFTQGMLNITRGYHKGPKLDDHGRFDADTERAVRAFQTFADAMHRLAGGSGVTIDGITGPQTNGALAFWVPKALGK